MAWAKIEDFGEGRTGCPAETKAEGFGPNRPGPPGLRLAGGHVVSLLGRATSPTFAPFLVDRHAKRQTE
jgi:hypothetical protein